MFQLWGSFQVHLQIDANVCKLMSSQNVFLDISISPHLSNLAHEWVTEVLGWGGGASLTSSITSGLRWPHTLRGPTHSPGNICPQLSSSNPRCQFYLGTPVQLVPSGPDTGAGLWVPTEHIWFEARLDWMGVFWKRTWDSDLFFSGNTWIPQELSWMKRQLRFPECHVWPQGNQLAYAGYLSVSCPDLEKHGITQEEVYLQDSSLGLK